MIKSLKVAMVAAAALAGAALSSGSASAMPVTGLAVVPAVEQSAQAQDVRIVCGPFRCFYRPNYYGYGYGPRPFYGPRVFYGPRPFYGPRRFYGRGFY